MAAPFPIVITLVILVLLPDSVQASPPTVIAQASGPYPSPISPYVSPEDILPCLWMCRLCGSIGAVQDTCRCLYLAYVRMNPTIIDPTGYIDPRCLNVHCPADTTAAEHCPSLEFRPSPAQMLRTKSQQSQASDAGVAAGAQGGGPLDALGIEVLRNRNEGRHCQTDDHVDRLFTGQFYSPGLTPREKQSSPYKKTSPFCRGTPDLGPKPRSPSDNSHGLGISLGPEPTPEPPPHHSLGLLPPPCNGSRLPAPMAQQWKTTPVYSPPPLRNIPATPPEKNSIPSSNLTDTPGPVSDSDVDADGDDDPEIVSQQEGIPHSDDGSSHSHSCRQCERKFPRECDLSRHAKRHIPATDRKHRCPEVGCKYSSHDAKDLSRHHTSIHSQERNFCCPHPSCEYHRRGMARKDNMTRHIKNRHPEAGPRRRNGRRQPERG